MSTSLTSVPLSSVNGQRMRAHSDPTKQNTIHISTTPIDIDHLSAYPTYQTYSTSASPSNFDTPAELTSENSVFSEYDYAGDDEFFGVNFDAAEDQVIDADPILLAGTTEQSATEAHLPQVQADKVQSSETTTSSTYPMSSNQSSPPSRHSPKSNTGTVPHSEILTGVTVSHSTMPYYRSTTLGSPSPSFAQAGGGYADMESIGLGVPNHMGHSPRLTLTSWEGMEQQEIRTEPDPQEIQYGGQQEVWRDDSQDYVSPNRINTDSQIVNSPHIDATHAAIGLDQQGAPDLNEGIRRTGIDPEGRESIAHAHLPNLKEQEEAARLRQKNMEVEEWRSQADDSTDADEEIPNQSSSRLNAPATSTRRRARTTGEIPGNFSSTTIRPIKQDPTEGEGIEPVSDSESVRENQIKPGQLYFNPRATDMSARDRNLMQELRNWSDGPIYPDIMNTRTQAPTAVEAAKRWNEASDAYSVLSRTATWGTRRRSEPSVADMESINNGSFLKRLSFKTDKDFKSEREKRSNPLIDTITNMVRKKSDSSKLKRKTSAKDSRGRQEAIPFIKQEGRSNLALPSGPGSSYRRGVSSPRLNTNVGGSSISGPSDARRGSVSATASSPPKSTLGLNIGARIKRARSGSNLQSSSKDGIIGMWKQTGGPPVAKLGAAPFDNESRQMDLDDSKAEDLSDADGEDDDDEELADDGEMMDFDQNTPIRPNFAGFQEHVIGLYPYIERTYLVDRIAHQQVVRYKALLQYRVKHQGLTGNQNCPAGHHCISLGGSPTLLEPKTQHRDSDASNIAAQGFGDGSDGDSNPEGALAAESFPPGVPMPPAQTLPAEFECQLCFRVKKFLKPSDWTKHVHEDVQPFTCTYANCKEPKSFKRKADWVRHENERHRRLSWWACTQDDCQHRCYRKDNFLQHLVREHKIPEPKQKNKAAAKKARNSDEPIWVLIRNCHHETTAKPQDEPCKFCGKVLNSWKKLTVHLAKHMELISLSVLRLVEQQPVTADTIISPVEAPPVRQPPLTPVDNSDRRPSTSSIQYSNLSASISPNVYPMSQFSSPLHPQVSPLIQETQQFQRSLYPPNIGYNMNTTGQDMSSYIVQAPIPQHQPEFMYDSTGMPYSQQMPSQMDSNLSRGFAMGQSPSLERTTGFSAVNGSYTPSNQQQNFHSYTNSTQTLSPDPASGFDAGPQLMPGFQGQSLAPHQQSFVTSPHHALPQQQFASSPHHTPSYPPQQVASFGDETMYSAQVLQQGHGGLPFDQMELGMRGQGGVGYPPTSAGGYSYHQQQ